MTTSDAPPPRPTEADQPDPAATGPDAAQPGAGAGAKAPAEAAQHAPHPDDCPPRFLSEPGAASGCNDWAPDEPVAAPPATSPVTPNPAPATAETPESAPAETLNPEPTPPVPEPVAQAPAPGLAPQPGGVPAFAAPQPSGFAVPAVITMTAHLRNTRVAEPYETRLEVEGLTDIRLESDTGSGLTYEADGRIWGTPQTAGDYTLTFIGKLNGMRCSLAAHLAVIPDPRTMWKSLPSDQSAPYWKKDQAFGRTEADLLCVAASVRGRSHAREGGFRDDDFCLHADTQSGWHIAAVADGAGSAKFSRRGSQIATQAVLEQLPGLLESKVTPGLEPLIEPLLQGHPEAAAQVRSQLIYASLVTAAFNAVKAIEAEAVKRGEPAAAYSTTLLIAAAKKIRDGLWFIASFAIGDGGIAVYDQGTGKVQVLSQADSGEFAGQTRFLHKSEFGSYEEIEPRMFFALVPDFTAIALMTDGITDPKFPTDAAFASPARWAEFWQEDLAKAVDLSRQNSQLKPQLLEWLEFWSPGNHDDRTISLLLP